jgi:uncharacterized damage-inducible protein DinB
MQHRQPAFFDRLQHRSEAAAMLTEYGHSPGNIDLLQFVRERQT